MIRPPAGHAGADRQPDARHGLFPAINCPNRLDGEDEGFDYIVDYKDLFKKVANAIAVYTFELDRSAGRELPVLLVADGCKPPHHYVTPASVSDPAR